MDDDSGHDSADQHGSLIDHHVGARIHERRVGAGLLASTMAQALDVPISAVVSWESGEIRIPASQLLAVGDLLSCPLTWFFEGFLAIDRFEDDVGPSEHDVTTWFSHHSDLKQ